MALSTALPVSANPQLIAFNSITQSSSTKHTCVACMPTVQKWSNAARDLTLVSDPSKYFDRPTQCGSFTGDYRIKHARKLSEVRHLLGNAGEDPLHGLVMIDVIQRLGIDYHFQEEIETVLQRQYRAIDSPVNRENGLYGVSLQFRLLRQQGYHVPADVFQHFKGKDGMFKEELGKDTKGLMGLYEAAQLSIQGEDILDEAANFSRQFLKSRMTHADDDQSRIFRNTLDHPHHKSLARFMIKNFLRDFKCTNDWENVLRELAKLDFKLVQSKHQKEILQVTKWWNDLDLAKELKFARDQPLKWYMWSMAILSDTSFSDERVDLTKPISLIYLIDDIYDVRGTLPELTLFTDAVNRWEFAAVEQLPDYMKICFKALYDVTNEIGYKVYKKYGRNPIDHLRKTWASLCDAFMVEAKWFASGQVPKAEDYLKNGIVSSGVHVVLVHLFFLLGHGTAKAGADLVNENCGVISSAAAILRLWDDLGSATDENQDGHDGSYIQCYMREHHGSSVEMAKQEVNEMISDAWKRLNQECLFPSPFSPHFKTASLNIARMVPLMYTYDDSRRLPILQEHVRPMLYDPLSSEPALQSSTPSVSHLPHVTTL